MSKVFNTAKDPGPIIAEIEKQKQKLLKRHKTAATRLYLGMEEGESMLREKHLWAVGQGPKGDARAMLLDLWCMQLKGVPSHIHVSYSKTDLPKKDK